MGDADYLSGTIEEEARYRAKHYTISSKKKLPSTCVDWLQAPKGAYTINTVCTDKDGAFVAEGTFQRDTNTETIQQPLAMKKFQQDMNTIDTVLWIVVGVMTTAMSIWIVSQLRR